MFRASRSQGEACVRGVFRPTREDGGLDRGHGVGRARLVGRQAGQILGGRSDAPAWSAARSGDMVPWGGRTSRVESSLQLLASFCGMVTWCTWGGASRKLLDRLGRGTGMIMKPRQHYGGWNPCA